MPLRKAGTHVQHAGLEEQKHFNRRARSPKEMKVVFSNKKTGLTGFLRVFAYEMCG